MPTRIAMWSGPRNISTALLRSWGSRADTAVCDEPLYACYLEHTAIDHPGAEEIIAAGPTDWRIVVARLCGPVPEGAAIHYQKHMAHHLVPSIELDWIDALTNCFLIREPRAAITSLAKVLPEPSLEATGLPQQVALLERLRRRDGIAPPVIEADDVLRDPRGVLTALCDRIGVPFDEAMLHWEPGPRATDGVWAKHWYAAVERSSGFDPPTDRSEPLPAHLRGLLALAEPLYALLAEHRLAPAAKRPRSTSGA